MHRADNRGFTLMEVLIVVAIIGVLASLAIPLYADSVERGRQSVDLENMHAAYDLAQVEWMSDPSDDKGPYYFNGISLQDEPINLKGYGQSTKHVSEFVTNFPVETTGTPNATGDSEGGKYLVVYCNNDGVSRVSWGGGSFGGKQALTREEHEAVAANDDYALELDENLLDALELAVRNMTFGEIKELAEKYNVPYESDHKFIQIAICNVNPETGLPNNDMTKIYMPEVFDAIGYDTKADNLYIIQSRDDKVRGDIIWVALGRDYTKAPADAKPTGAYTYVKSNGDYTDTVLSSKQRSDTKKRKYLTS